VFPKKKIKQMTIYIKDCSVMSNELTKYADDIQYNLLDLTDAPKALSAPTIDADISMDVATDCLIQIFRLSKLELVEEDEIKDIAMRYNIKLKKLTLTVSDPDLINTVLQYLADKINGVKNYALDAECYEILYNLKEFEQYDEYTRFLRKTNYVK
jgi:hypothetical protein